MRDIYAAFTALLEERLSAKIPTTEDAVRYTFFYSACTTRCLLPHKIILEGEHATDQKAHIDATLLLKPEGQVAVEFKYHRALQSGGPRPRPHQAGTVVADIARLARHTPADVRLLVYLTDSEMAKYMRNPKNGMSALFDPETPAVLSPKYFVHRPPTFWSAAGKSIHGTATCVWTKQLPNSHELRIWKVT